MRGQGALANLLSHSAQLGGPSAPPHVGFENPDSPPTHGLGSREQHWTCGGSHVNPPPPPPPANSSVGVFFLQKDFTDDKGTDPELPGRGVGSGGSERGRAGSQDSWMSPSQHDLQASLTHRHPTSTSHNWGHASLRDPLFPRQELTPCAPRSAWQERAPFCALSTFPGTSSF